MTGLRQPILVTAGYLLLLYVLAVYWRMEGIYESELGRMGAMIGGFLVPHLVTLMAFGARPRISSLVITMLILALLADVNTSPAMMAWLGLVTASIKTVVRFKSQPVFNPAAAGLVAMSFFGLATTWWGVSFAPRLPLFNMSAAMLLILPAGLLLMWIHKKILIFLGVVISFLVVYFLLTQKIPVAIMLEGTFAFFLLLMATEPKTSPVVDWQKWVYGLIFGTVMAVMLVNNWGGSPYLGALLIMNLMFASYRWIQVKLA